VDDSNYLAMDNLSIDSFLGVLAIEGNQVRYEHHQNVLLGRTHDDVHYYDDDFLV
jgi:hypothetical protein